MPQPLHPKLEAFFVKHRTSTAVHRAAAHAHLVPVSAATGEIRAYVVEMQHALHAAELEAHDGRLDPKLTYLHSRLRALEAAAQTLFQAQRDFTGTLAGVEKGLSQAAIDAAAMMQARIVTNDDMVDA